MVLVLGYAIYSHSRNSCPLKPLGGKPICEDSKTEIATKKKHHARGPNEREDRETSRESLEGLVLGQGTGRQSDLKRGENDGDVTYYAG